MVFSCFVFVYVAEIIEVYTSLHFSQNYYVHGAKSNKPYCFEKPISNTNAKPSRETNNTAQ